MTAKRVELPGWAAWPYTYYYPDTQVLRVSGRCEPPGPYSLLDGVYVALVIAALWMVGGPPDELMGRWIALAVGIVDDHTKAWLAFGVLAAAPAAYLLWKRIVLFLLGERIDVRAGEDSVEVRRWWRVQIYPRVTGLEILREPHRKAAAVARGGWVPFAGSYANAFEVVVRIGEKRAVIAAMKASDEEKSEALTLRVNVVVRAYEKVREAAGGPRAGPAPEAEFIG